MWYRFQPPHDGTYTFDASASDFPAAIAIVGADGALQSPCERPFYDAPTKPQRRSDAFDSFDPTYYIYIARAPGAQTLGHAARLRVVEGALLLYNTSPPTISGTLRRPATDLLTRQLARGPVDPPSLAGERASADTATRVTVPAADRRADSVAGPDDGPFPRLS